MSSSGLQRLKVWLQAKELALDIYHTVIPCLPLEEKWGLSSQLRRSVASIPANITEGYGRFYYQANIQFCYNARGSLEETISHISLASELGYLPDDVTGQIIAKADALVLLLNGYIAYLRKSKQGKNEAEVIGQKVSEQAGGYFTDEPGLKEVGFDDSQFSTLDSLH